MLIGQGALGARRRGRCEVADAARRRRGQGAQRPRRAARRPAVRHRLDRPARHQAVRRHDGGLRHAADGRHELPVLGVAARAGPGARRCRSTSTARLVGMRYPIEVNLVGDAAETLRALLPLLERKADRVVARGDRGRRRALVARSSTTARSQSADPVNPQLVFHELSPRLPDRAILTADSGSATNWWARHLRMRDGMKAALSGTLATMCPAVPYALAAKFAYPGPAGDRRDRRRRDADDRHQRADRHRPLPPTSWTNQRLVVVRAAQRRPQPGHLGAARDVRRPEARGLAGAARLRLRRLRAAARPARRCASTARRTSARRGTSAWPPAGRRCSRSITDPEVPPLPPHIRFEQAKGMAQGAARPRPGARAR